MCTLLLVLALRKGVKRTDLASAPLKRSQTIDDLLSLRVAQRVLRGLDLRSEALADIGQLATLLGAPIAEAGCLDLRPGQEVGGALQLALKLIFALRALAHLGCDPIAVGVASEDPTLSLF